MNSCELLQNSGKESIINFNIENGLGIGKKFKLNTLHNRPSKKKKTQGLFYCDLCPKLYSRSDSLSRHRRTQHKQSKLKKKKNKQFNIEPIILETYHINEESNSNQYTCDKCSLSCYDMTGLLIHMKNYHQPKELKKYDNFYNSNSNFESTSSLDQNKLFTCHLCEMSFTSSDGLSYHQNSLCCGSNIDFNHIIESSNFNEQDDEIIYITDTTPCSASQPDNAEETINKNDAQNVCTDMNQIEALKSFHYDVQVFDCDICLSKCSRYDHLEIYHWTKADSDENEEIFECYVCSNFFSDKESLKLHEIEHIDQMIF